jgi:hypothetical protein
MRGDFPRNSARTASSIRSMAADLERLYYELDPDNDSDLARMHRMPGLAAPFAMVGAAAALFSVLGLGAARESVRWTEPISTAVVAAIAGAMVGAALRRWQTLHEPMMARGNVALRVACLVLPAAAFMGGVVGNSTWGEDAIPMYGLGGAVVGLAFLPSCLEVLEAARSAARARLGSLVAEADRRTTRSTLLVVVVLAAGLQAPAIALGRFSKSLPPLAQAGLSVAVSAAAAVALAVLRE